MAYIDNLHAALRVNGKVLWAAMFEGNGGIAKRKERVEAARDVLAAHIDAETDKCMNLLDSPRFAKCPLPKQWDDEMLKEKNDDTAKGGGDKIHCPVVAAVAGLFAACLFGIGIGLLLAQMVFC